MPAPSDHIDKPEPRWQAILALLAIGGIYLALPRDLVIGPIWLVPAVIVVLLVPTVVSHRVGRQSLNRTLGIIISGITTLALIGSVILLVRALPTHREPAVAVAALRGTPLADECDGVRALVLATGRRWAVLAPQTKEIRQHKFSLSADANPA